jgi:hypothetical protein
MGTKEILEQEKINIDLEPIINVQLVELLKVLVLVLSISCAKLVISWPNSRSPRVWKNM